MDDEVKTIETFERKTYYYDKGEKKISAIMN